MRVRILTVALMLIGIIPAVTFAQSHNDAEAIRINNRGVAEMGQQMTERAAATFTAAFDKDPKLAQAAINKGIALLYLQKIDEAKAAFTAALALDPKNAQAWYNLGLAQHAANELDDALKSFQHVVAIDPRDADSYYYEGVCYQELKDFDHAIGILTKAIEIEPLHASSEFALARALQRSGRTEEAKPHFARFKHLTTTKVSSAIGLAYGEQGHYSTVSTVAEPEGRAKPAVAVKFRPEVLAAGNAKGFTGGACVIDVTGTGVEDFVLLGDSAQAGAQAVTILHPNGKGGFDALDAAAMGIAAKGDAVACAVGDYDGDGLNDLAIALDDQLLLFRNLGKGKFQDVTAEAGLAAKNHPSGLTFVDYDHDGNLDLLVTGRPLKAGDTPNVLWRNKGNKTFADMTEATGFGGIGNTTAAILTDFNNDRAVDIVTAGIGLPLLYINPREGKYPTQGVYGDTKISGAWIPPTRGIAVLDFNKDGWMDLAFTHAGAPGVTLWKNVAGPNGIGRGFERVTLPIANATAGWGLTPIDFDNDGWIDLAVLVETKTGPELRVLRNRGDGSFEDMSRAVGVDKVKLSAPRGLIAVEENGAASLLVTQLNAPPVLVHNPGTGTNHSVRIDLTGFADNKTAIGAKVEIFAGGHWQKWEIAGASGFQTQGSPHLLVGLGDATGVDLIRILWPTGVLQDEIDLAHEKVVAIKEADRRGSSCPVLFAWNGKKYTLVTDVIGAGVVGHWFTPERKNIPRPGEWIKVPGEMLKAENGELSLRFIEPMEEVNYIDQLRLVAVDHPNDVEVNPDERFLDGPPFATGRVIASRATRLPVGAWDGEGRDVLGELSKADHRFASGFTASPFDGFANLHALTIDLGTEQAEAKSGAPLRLLMTGYVNYFSATSLYAAWQADVRPISPYAEALMPDGSWKKISGDLGFPAGLERTIVMDLTGKVPEGVRKIRLMSNLEIYWDQVLIDDHDEAEAKTTEVPMSTATLRFHGYPKQLDGKSNGDLDYDYDLVSLTGPFQHQRGSYTRMGDVTPLLNVSGKTSDQFVIFGSGEEIAAEFDAAKLPELPKNWNRDYFFYADGYVKDMDYWDASPFTVAQLPFHSMSRYPYPATESYPDSIEYELNWNTRFDSGEPVRAYRFDYHRAATGPENDRSAEPPTVK
jgi:tetratricopeptide (TPR) repeat protein